MMLLEWAGSLGRGKQIPRRFAPRNDNVWAQERVGGGTTRDAQKENMDFRTVDT